MATATATGTAPRETSAGMIDPRELEAWMRDGSAEVIDVREPDEHAREHIPGARLVPLSRFDPAGVPHGRTLVLHCKSGKRSAEAAARLAAAGRTDVVQLKGGIEAWKAAGLPVNANPRLPISVMRQVQLVAGGMVALGTLLGASVSPWFLIVPAFFGIGLFIAGATGTCGLGTMLAAMPWNRGFRAAGSGGAACGRSCG
jgi:rhodanese-related sulfurtransferase